MTVILICDVCRMPAMGVYSSSLGAVSFAYCHECAAAGAEPYGVIVGMFAMLGGSVEAVSEDFLTTLFVSVVIAGKSVDDFWRDVREALADFEAMADFGSGVRASLTDSQRAFECPFTVEA